MYKTNIEGTTDICKYCACFRDRKIVHVSSIAAIGGKPDELITEETKWEKINGLRIMVLQNVGGARNFRGIAEGLNAVIVNPG